MSRHVCVRCACGEKDFDGSSLFTQVVWGDLLGALENAGIDNPYRYAEDDSEVDGAAFLAAWRGVLDGLEGARGRLPTLYEVWRRESADTEVSDAGYFALDGTVYMVEGVFDELVARPLLADVWAERRAQVPYDPPEAAAELASASPGADVPLTAEAFERIFRGTPLRLEHGELGDYFAGELREVEEVARHAAERGESVILHTY